jgi:hypothetical protein
MRWLLAISISVWMAGGCLFGCSNTAMANTAMAPHNSAPATVVGKSCHAKHAKQPLTVATLAPAPHGTMNDCPLVVNATAATSKNSGHLPDPARGPVIVAPFIESTSAQQTTFVLALSPPNRGPTYLRCCVFLI